ncbi:homeobox protein Meis2-like [Mytilus edulis]|uniref:homeobox protein Meis2-like n=1 Tax=Mytilus edulis TaxID=6550 RepID=UPI0039F0B9CD
MFINARRRIVQPMIDQSNRAAPGGHGYSPESMGWDSQAMAHMSPHMFQGRHGSEMYDQMKGYSHMEGQRYDMLGVQGMHSSDMFGSTAVSGSSSYSQMSQLRPPVHSQAMLIPGHPHHMMMGHGADGMSPMSMGSAQSPPLHGSLDSMGAHIQDIHAG